MARTLEESVQDLLDRHPHAVPGITFKRVDGLLHMMAPEGYVFDVNMEQKLVTWGINSLHRQLGYGLTKIKSDGKK